MDASTCHKPVPKIRVGLAATLTVSDLRGDARSSQPSMAEAAKGQRDCSRNLNFEVDKLTEGILDFAALGLFLRQLKLHQRQKLSGANLVPTCKLCIKTDGRCLGRDQTVRLSSGITTKMSR